MMKKNNLDSALILLKKSISLKAPEESYFGVIYYEVADIFKSQGFNDSTLYYLQLCLKEAIRLKEVGNEAKAHNALSEFHLENNDSSAAQNHAALGYAIAHNNNLSEWIVPLTEKLGFIHRRKGDFKKALEYKEENNLHTKKLAKENTEILLKNAEMSRDIQLWSDKLTAEITAMQAEKKMIYGAAIVLLVLALWLFYLYYEIQKLNARLVVRNEEVETAMHKFKEAQTKLIQSEKMASLGILTAGIAHEINNPLNYISGTSTILETYVEENLQEHKETLNPYFTALSTGVERVTKIVSGLNFYSRSTESCNDFCDIVSIIDSTLVIVKHQLTEDTKIEKEFSFTETIKGNAGKLHQVFLNIIVNAIQAIDGTGRIIISTEREDNFMVVKISDTGCGIDSKDIEKIPDPFYSNKEVGSGVGLGMYISLDIIKDHNGSLVYQSKKGEGTTAIISLPIIK